jgi:hypothetical protein
MARFDSKTSNVNNGEEIVLGPKIVQLEDQIVGAVWSSGGGSLHIEQSGSGNDNTWDIRDTVAITASTVGNPGVRFSTDVFLTFIRVRFVSSAANNDVRIVVNKSSAGNQI